MKTSGGGKKERRGEPERLHLLREEKERGKKKSPGKKRRFNMLAPATKKSAGERKEFPTKKGGEPYISISPSKKGRGGQIVGDEKKEPRCFQRPSIPLQEGGRGEDLVHTGGEGGG